MRSQSSRPYLVNIVNGAKEVDCLLAYWKQPGREAWEQFAVLEFEVFDLLCPAGG